ncbi:MAG TPA: SPOR domain-containing protein [Steroidobacteraceae bacterium]
MKERLTGAIILVALIVLLVPELLTGPIGTHAAPAASSAAASQPAEPTSYAEPPLRSYTLTLGAADPAHPAPAMPTAQAPAQPAEGFSDSPPDRASAGQISEPGRVLQQAAAPQGAQFPASGASVSQESLAAGSGSLQVAKSPTRSSVREARALASSGGWVVQLGSFASRHNADRLAHSLAGRGFRTSVSPAKAGRRVLWRVRAGPARDRASAQRLAARLRTLGHHGELLPVK